ncbi:MAG: hypothetical protein ACQ9MH_05560 [Nitrospinales bacterium]
MISDINTNILICLGTAILVYFILWLKDDNKIDLIKGYIVFTLLASFGSFLVLHVIFGDFNLSIVVKTIGALGLNLILTQSPFFLIYAKGDENAKKKLKEMYSKKD